jgi:glycosyltransferase 2 family protein
VKFQRPVLRWLKPLAGLLLLAGMVLAVDPGLLTKQLEQARWGWLLAAVAAALLANVLCAYRWQQIAKAMQLQGAEGISLWCWFKLYLQGVSVNSVLPGGIIGGDVWRASQFKPLVASGQAVFLERLSGLWGLFCLSALATLWPALSYGSGGAGAGNAAAGASTAGSGTTSAGGFVMDFSLLVGWEWMVWCAALAPFLLLAALQLQPVKQWRVRVDDPPPTRVGRGLARVLNAAEHPLVLKSLPLSILSQWLTVLAFWFCMVAAGASLGLAEVTVLASAVFLSALVPASMGGFGAREAGAVFFLGWVGVAAESALLGSVFFGLTATLQGLMGLVWWMRPIAAGSAKIQEQSNSSGQPSKKDRIES